MNDRLLLRNVQVPVDADSEAIARAVSKRTGLPATQLSFDLERLSLDARKGRLNWQIQVLLSAESSAHFNGRRIPKDSAWTQPYRWRPTVRVTARDLGYPPIIVGAGPAGLLAAWGLATHGIPSLVVEQGEAVDRRIASVRRFWDTGVLNPFSNVQFGEGGAGTFSDGKLTARGKNPRQRIIYDLFVSLGAPRDILWQHHPHIGTDLMRRVIAGLRRELEALGCTFLFGCHMETLESAAEAGAYLVKTTSGTFKTRHVILTPGHSARSTFRMLDDIGFSLEAKPFAIGLRIEHTQQQINRGRYGDAAKRASQSADGGPLLMLPPADYRLTCSTQNGARSVYTFCMCPGGVVVNASSEAGRLCINGMSERARDGRQANAALLAAVNERDYGSGALAGLVFQENLESAAYAMGGGEYRVPVSTVGDFLAGTYSNVSQSIVPTVKPSVTVAPLGELFSTHLTASLREGIRLFGKQLPGFDDPEAVLSAVEARSSSPVRILRSPETLEAIGFPRIFPGGEGAGYSGGIISSAVDGLMIAERILGN